VFENRVLRGVFGAKWDGVTGEWRRLPNEELYDLYASENTFRVINYRRVRWVGHVARIKKKKRNTYRILLLKLTERDQLEDLGLSVTIILEWI
jgi:hypothetical protein